MKNTIVNLIVVATLSCCGAALAAGEMEDKAQPPANQPPATASAVPPAASAEPAESSPAAEPPPSLKSPASSKSIKAHPVRSKDLDLRHCLNLEGDAAIAKCAGE